MEEREDGRLKIYHEPKDGLYSIGADVAEGLEGGDYSTAFVLDKDLRQCAQWKGRIDPDEFGNLLCRLGEYYNNALLAVEKNNHGHATMAAIKNKNYTNVYSETIKEQHSEGYTKKIGWHTNAKTKMLMLDEFVGAVRDDSIELNDLELIKEMGRLNVEPNGDVVLNSMDLVVSACIALQAIKQVHGDNYSASRPKDIIKKLPFKERLKRLSKTKEFELE